MVEWFNIPVVTDNVVCANLDRSHHQDSIWMSRWPSHLHHLMTYSTYVLDECEMSKGTLPLYRYFSQLRMIAGPTSTTSARHSPDADTVTCHLFDQSAGPRVDG